MSVTDQKIIFITGASRSGTTLLSFVLRNHREVFGLKELQFFGEAWDPRSGELHLKRADAIEAAAQVFARQAHGILAARVGPEQRAAAAAVVEGLDAKAEDPAQLFAAVVRQLAQSAGKTIPCEQTPRNIFYASALLERYPRAHVVHMVRDPRAVLASQKRRWQRRRLARDGVAVPRYESFRVWVNYHPFTVARLWSRATAEAIRLAGHPRFTVVRFEDLVREPAGTVRGLCARLGLDYDHSMLDVGQINSSHQSAVGGARRGLQADAIDAWKAVLSRTEVAIAEKYCALHMSEFGYTPEMGGSSGWVGELGYRLSYLAHLGGVVLVNPHRAWVQGRALFGKSLPPADNFPAAAVSHDADKRGDAVK